VGVCLGTFRSDYSTEKEEFMDRRSFLTASGALAIGLITPRRAQAGITVGPDTNVSANDPKNQIAVDGECTIAVDPTTGRLFAAAHWGGSEEAGWYSWDGGQTWKNSFLGMPNCGGDGFAKYDSGVLYLVLLSSGPPYQCMLAVSTDYGCTFTPYTVSMMSCDQPSVAIGPNYGTTGRAVWITAEALVGSSYPVFLWGASANNLNAFIPYQVANSANGNFGGIAVGPHGEVVASYIQPDTGEGPTAIYMVRLPHGLRDPPVPPPSATAILTSNVGGQVYLPAQPHRHIENKIQLAWDRNYAGSPCGRLYAVYLDRAASSSPSYNISVYIIYSNDAGATWNGPIRVSDGTGSSKFNAAIAVDPSTGYVCVTWYDCRNSPTKDTAQIYGAISTSNGTSWSSNFPVATYLSDGKDAPNGGFDFGDFDTMDAANGYFWRAWADNSNNPMSDLTPQNPFQNGAFCMGAAYITLQ
jgi:hypothetical protein